MNGQSPSEFRRGSVAVALHEPQLGGATRSLLRAVPLLQQRGWRFSFWVPGRGAAERELRALGYPVAGAERLLRFRAASLKEPPGPRRRLTALPGYLRGFRAWLRAQQADVLHANTLLALPELAARPRGRLPVMLHVHEALPGGAKGRVAGRLAGRADAVVAVSGAVAEPLRRHGVKPQVVYPGVGLPPPGGAPTGRDGRLVVGTIGTVCRRKGSDLFLAAAQRLHELGGGPFEFRMVGEPVVGGEQQWAERALADARAEGIIHRAGVNPYSELADWDVFVMPSRMDPCPLAVLEAMAMRVPVVGTRVGGIPEELGDDAGLLVEREDVEGIAAAVLRLAKAPALRESLGVAARNRVRSLFTLERQADGLDRAYRAALEA